VEYLTSKQRGSVLLMVMIIATVVGLSAFSLLRTTSHFSRIAEQHVTRLKAESTAEALLEYGVAQLANQLKRKTSFPEDELQPGNKPLVIPDSATAFFKGSNVDMSSLELRAGLLPSGEWTYISPVDLLYEFDELAGKIVFSRNVEMYSKATVRSNLGRDATIYLNETFVVRDAPLFTNAIFYNSDLEFHPGYDTDIRGPVHTNGTLFVEVNLNQTLRFFGKVSSAEEILRESTYWGGGSILFPSSFDPLTYAAMGTGSSMLNSISANWQVNATDRWNGFVQDASMGIKPQNVVAFNNYTPDDPTTLENERDNSAYALIEPLLPSGHVNQKSESIRNQKIAFKAGLVIKLEPGGVLKGYTPVRNDPASALSSPKLDANGDVMYTEVVLPADLIGDPDSTFSSIENNQPEYYSESDTTRSQYSHRYWNQVTRQYVNVYRDVRETVVTGGLYDHRENREVDTVVLDVERLKHYIENKDNSAAGFNGTFDVEKQWNGVVYVEFPTSLATTDGSFEYGTATNSYNVVPAVDSDSGVRELALMLMDTKEVPEPTNVVEQGFTIASNAPTYVIGSFNADGIPHIDDSTIPDDELEQPAAIIADSVTLLSDNWRVNRQFTRVDGRSNISRDRPASAFIEIAAAIVTGTPNSLPSGASFPTTDASRPHSLGVINLPRFLEYWGSSRTVTIRGSLVSLFESEVRPDGAPSNFNDYYIPPVRDWGFNNLFGQGRFPPGTPVIRNYRRINFAGITEAEYDAAIMKLDNL